MAGGPRRTQTNADGRFLFNDLPPGSYSLDATKPGYVPGALGRFRPGGLAQSLSLADGEKNNAVKISVWKYAAISGTLIDDVGEPLVGVTVQALRRSYELGRPQFGATSSSVSTDDRGAFRLASLTPGDYVLCVTATQSTVPVALAEAYAQARLTGNTDLQRELSASGGLSALALPSGGGMKVGDYLVQSSSPYARSGVVSPEPAEDGRFLSFQTTFFPGVFSLAQAEVLTVASGEERSNLHLQLKLVPTAAVSGTVTGPEGPVPNVGLRLVPGHGADVSFEEGFDAAVTVTDASGAFRFLGVPVGQYSIRAIKVPVAPLAIRAPGQPVAVSGVVPPIPPGPTLWASLPINVGTEGLSNVTVRMNTGFRLSGRFEFVGTLPKPPPAIVQTLSVLIQPIDGHQSGFARALQSRVDPDGTITTYELPPGKYVIRMSAPTESWLAMPGWASESVMVGGRDIAVTPLDLQGDVTGLVFTLTDHPTEISGTARDSKGKIDSGAAVIVFSADPANWSNFGEIPRNLRLLRASPAGAYRIVGLPPGGYFVAALPDAQAGDWQDPRVLQALSRNAARITVAKGEKKTQDVVTRPIR
jgi:protocatechuate 3,4-dioxygenase beta subunit